MPLDPTPDAAELKLPHAESSEYCGPDQLCRVLLMVRRWGKAERGDAAISEAGLRRLLDLAFQASLSTEEGRHPQFRIYVPAPQEGPGTLRSVVRFEPPLELGDHMLRRIAPSLGSRGHALRIVEREKKLLADSIVGVADESERLEVGSAHVVVGAAPPGLMLRIDGPGILRVTERSTWELRAGRIQAVHHYSFVSVVRRWFEDLASTFLEQTSTAIDLNLDGVCDRGDATTIFDAVWSHLLSAAVQAHHGGAFVILPGALGVAPIHLAYSAERLDLMKAALAFWNSCFDARRMKDTAELRAMAQSWDAARQRMFSASRALADLANVDGCVVLDRRLRLYGFGGEIRVGESDVAGYRVFAAHPETLAEQEPIEIERFGTRHRSASRLCAAVPGTLTFVVSQDGDLRILYGLPGRRVCMWRHVGVWTTAAGRW